jgi:hypothetical protein
MCIFPFASTVIELPAELYAVSSAQKTENCRAGIPAGSLRCDKFVKSSLASSILGFIRGGSFGLLSSARASAVVSMVLVCRIIRVSTDGSWDVGEPLYLELEVTNLAVC